MSLQITAMPLREKLIFREYFPENLSPAFFPGDIGDFIADHRGTDWWTNKRYPVRAAPYNASKRGITRRVFSLVHPVAIRDAATFVEMHWHAINSFLTQVNDVSYSIPRERVDADGKSQSGRALEIASHHDVEAVKIEGLSQYRFIAKTDISRFYHSIYTHSIPWAFHGRDVSKADRKHESTSVYFNRADHILSGGQDGQTIGIPVGPDTSRVFAEIVAAAIDLEFRRRLDAGRTGSIRIIRYIDDVWIGAHSHSGAELALARYREAIREFELDINENKTRIYSNDFQFVDRWPSELSISLETALSSTGSRRSERLRSGLEHAFRMSVDHGDDGVLKYVIRYLDKHDSGWRNWDIGEPFLKRSVTHFGHTVDYVARVVVWRNYARGDLDKESWARIFANALEQHARVGNDSEVCWIVYACAQLGCQIDLSLAGEIVRSCGPLSVVSILNCVEFGLVKQDIFDIAHERFRTESADGLFWPLLLEWKSRKWPRHQNIDIKNDIVKGLVKEESRICDLSRRPPVFAEARDDAAIDHAIEDQGSPYDDDGGADAVPRDDEGNHIF